MMKINLFIFIFSFFYLDEKKMSVKETLFEHSSYIETFLQMFADFLTDYVQPSCYDNTWLMRHRDEIIGEYLNGKYKGFPAPDYNDYFKPETIKTFLKFFETKVKEVEEEYNFVLTYDEDKVNESLSNLKLIFELASKTCQSQ